MFRAKEYIRVHSLKEAWQLNQRRSSLVVGGMMWVKMWDNIKITAIDLSGLNLDGIEETDGEFSIGCMCSLRNLELHQGINQYFGGIFRESLRHIVGVQFRNGATVGGSIFGRFGFSDVLTCMMALDAYVELYDGGVIPLHKFAAMPYDRDILVRLIIKKDGRRAAYAGQRLTETDFPLISCAAGKLGERWYFSVGARPSRAALVVLDDREDKRALAREAAGMYRFADNMRGSKEYRAALAGVYLERLIAAVDVGNA